MYSKYCKNDAVDHFIETVGAQYEERVGHKAEFYVVDIGDGARIFKNKQESKKCYLKILKKLVQYGIDTGLTPECERIYTTNLLLDFLRREL